MTAVSPMGGHLRRVPTDVAGLAPLGTHLARLHRSDPTRLQRWSVRAWSVDGRPMVYRPETGRLSPMDATGLELHNPIPGDDPDALSYCTSCALLKERGGHPA